MLTEKDTQAGGFKAEKGCLLSLQAMPFGDKSPTRQKSGMTPNPK